MYLNITFDYELFFGDNYGTYDEVLFQPTYQLINALENKGVSATFFADVCSIETAKKYNQNAYVEGFSKQLQHMIGHGQDVQLHLHPHWFYSTWDNGKWIFSNKGYKINDFCDNEMRNIIFKGVEYLRDTLCSVDQNYQCIAYRAGGFSLQPHNRIVHLLYDNGIRVDSSIAPQLKIKSETQNYDYCHKLEQLNWHISENADWWEDCTNGKNLLEIPIATIDKSCVMFVLKRLFRKDRVKLDLGLKRGAYISIHTQPKNRIKKYFDYILGYNAVSMDAYTADYLYEQVKRICYKNQNNVATIALIGHPKLVTDKYINNLCHFIDLINKDERFQFISIKKAYEIKESSYATTEKIQ